jgi:hypothetical protein
LKGQKTGLLYEVCRAGPYLPYDGSSPISNEKSSSGTGDYLGAGQRKKKEL